MESTLYVPLAHPMTLLQDSLTDYRVTWLSCLVMIFSRALHVRKWRKVANGRPRVVPIWPLTFYWPVYVWGLQAVTVIVFGVLSGCWTGGPGLAQHLQMLCWGAVYASTLSCLYVVTICASTQWVMGRMLGIQAGNSAGIPIPACAAVVNVMFVNSFIILVLATMD